MSTSRLANYLTIKQTVRAGGFDGGDEAVAKSGGMKVLRVMAMRHRGIDGHDGDKRAASDVIASLA